MPRRIALALFLLSLSLPGQTPELPNILWITSEDNGQHLGCYGDPDAKTPALDALARRGLRFRNAFSNAPVCAPARTAIIAGMYPTSLGAQHMRSLVALPEEVRLYPRLLRDAGYFCTNARKEDFNVAKRGRLWSKGPQHWRQRREGQPFFAIFNHTITHESQLRNAMGKEHEVHDPATVRIPGYHPDEPEIRAGWARYHDRMTMMDQRAGRNLSELAEAALAEDTIVFYFGDHGAGMPGGKRCARDAGLRVPLIVAFPEKWKHLAPTGYKPGGVTDRLVSFVDLAPTLVSLTGRKPPSWMQGHAFAGPHQPPPPSFAFGFRGRMDERPDMVRTVHDGRYIYIRNYMPHRVPGEHVQYMFETPATRAWERRFHQGTLDAAQSWFWRRRHAEELYDLSRDPDETLDLAGSPKHREVLARLRAAHRDHVLRIRDLGFLPEAEIHSRSSGSPRSMAQDGDAYPIERIFRAASVATAEGPASLAAVTALMRDEDSAVRYWGAIGLLLRGRTAVEKSRAPLGKALEDKAPAVRVAAAEALALFGSDEELPRCLEVLIAAIAPDADPYVGISAWNALDALDDRALSVRERILATPVKLVNPPPRSGNYAGRLKKKVLRDLALANGK